MSNLMIRIITALILGAATLWLTWIGGFFFAIFAWLIGAAVLYEWMSITAPNWYFLQKILAVIFYIVFGGMLLFALPPQDIFIFIFIAAFVLALTGLRKCGWTACGFLYASLPSAALAFLRGDEPFGFGAIIFLFAVVWGTDIAAYFNGRALGGPKLAPRFSPNKTWSGAIGGAVVGVGAGTLVAFVALNTSAANVFIPILALVLSIVSQVGDIGESWIKRRFSVKDSGSLLPGHGGFMDRVDGLVIAALLLYVIGAIMADANVPSNLFNLI